MSRTSAPLWTIPLALLLGVALGLLGCLRGNPQPQADLPETAPVLTLRLEWEPELPPPLECVPTRHSDARVSYAYRDRGRCLAAREAVLNLLHAEQIKHRAP